jgi:hypothetical protein
MKKGNFKLGLLGLMLMTGTVLQAQSTVATDVGLVKDAGAGVSVKLVDNKGTIKYLQTNNGITSITSTTAGSATTTTWQLGGELTNDTYIDANANVFALDGLELVDTATLSSSTDATDQSDHGTGTGWTLLVRDEVTGAIKKLKATDMIESGSVDYPAVLADETAGTKAIPVVGIPTGVANRGKIWVFRNGAKLIYGTDFTVTADVVTVTEVATSWDLYTDDVFEIQWIK